MFSSAVFDVFAHALVLCFGCAACVPQESLSTQRLWRETAGKRPRQPSEERQFFEEQWAKNFSDSEVGVFVWVCVCLCLGMLTYEKYVNRGRLSPVRGQAAKGPALLSG